MRLLILLLFIVFMIMMCSCSSFKTYKVRLLNGEVVKAEERFGRDLNKGDTVSVKMFIPYRRMLPGNWYVDAQMWEKDTILEDNSGGVSVHIRIGVIK